MFTYIYKHFKLRGQLPERRCALALFSCGILTARSPYVVGELLYIYM